jgi:hypothetical protein
MALRPRSLIDKSARFNPEAPSHSTTVRPAGEPRQRDRGHADLHIPVRYTAGHAAARRSAGNSVVDDLPHRLSPLGGPARALGHREAHARLLDGAAVLAAAESRQRNHAGGVVARTNSLVRASTNAGIGAERKARPPRRLAVVVGSGTDYDYKGFSSRAQYAGAFACTARSSIATGKPRRAAWRSTAARWM